MTTTTGPWALTADNWPNDTADLNTALGVAGLAVLATVHDVYRQAQAAEDKGFMAGQDDVALQGHGAVATLRQTTARLFTRGDESLAVALLDTFQAFQDLSR